MSMEKIACPIIATCDDRVYDGQNPQVFIRFDDHETPIGIMCPYYVQSEEEGQTNQYLCDLCDDKCAYSKWNPLKG